MKNSFRALLLIGSAMILAPTAHAGSFWSVFGLGQSADQGKAYEIQDSETYYCERDIAGNPIIIKPAGDKVVIYQNLRMYDYQTFAKADVQLVDKGETTNQTLSDFIGHGEPDQPVTDGSHKIIFLSHYFGYTKMPCFVQPAAE